MTSIWTTFLLLLICDGAFFQMSPGQDRCFLEGVPHNFLLTVSFGIRAFRFRRATTPITGVSVVVTDPNGVAIHTEHVRNQANKIELVSRSSATASRHTICFKSNATTWNPKAPWRDRAITVDINIDVGLDHRASKELASRAHISDLEMAVQSIGDLARDAHDQVADIVLYDMSISDTFGEVPQRLLLWFTFQILVMLITGP